MGLSEKGDPWPGKHGGKGGKKKSKRNLKKKKNSRTLCQKLVKKIKPHQKKKKKKRDLKFLVCVLKIKEKTSRSFCCGSSVTNLTSIHEDMGSIPGLAQWVGDPALP